MKTQLQQNIWTASMIAAPLILAIAQFYWVDGVLTATAGALQVLSFLCWIFAFQGMFHHIRHAYPNYAVWGFCLAVYGCLAGNNFGVDGIYIDAYKVLVNDPTARFSAKTGGAALVAFFIPGILAPLSWFVLGALFLAHRKVPAWVAVLLMIAAVGFPLSRMPRIGWLAHLDNALLLISMVLIALRLHRAADPAQPVSAS